MNDLQRFIQSKPCGFLNGLPDVTELVKLDRLCPVLVRCDYCRFTCAAQDFAHLLRCIVAGGDYIRDVSFPVGSFDRAASWVQTESIQKTIHRAAQTKASNLLGVVQDKRQRIQTFNEADCGGVFDGFSVSSDADPGL